MDITLNQFDIDKTVFDYDKINSLYDFYLIENEGKSFKPDSNILYESSINKDILSIQYTVGSSFLIMLKKSNLNKNVINQLIEKYNSENDNNLKQKKLIVPFEKFPHSLLQLLFNALAKSSSNESCSNIGGKLYYFSETRSKQIHCIQFKINSDYTFELKSKTFTEALENSKQRRFILQTNNTLIPADKNSKQKQYVDFQYNNTKHAVTFLEIKSLQAFEISKVGILDKLLQKFNKSYGDFIKLEFRKETDWNKLEVKSSASQKVKHLGRIQKLLKNKTINIVDKIHDASSKYFCDQLKSIYDSMLNDVEVLITTKTKNNALNICAIHNKTYYEINKDEKDTYENSGKSIIQNITLEDFTNNKGEISEAACLVVLNELIVKEDIIKNHKITIADWSSYNFDKNLIFCWYEKNDDNINHYYFMEVKPNGEFEIGEKSKDLFNQEQFEKIEEIFELNNMKAERHNKYSEKYEGLILNDKDEINILQDTSFFMLPEYSLISQNLKTGKISRSKDSLIKYFKGCLDIYYKNTDESVLYSSGQIGSGMNTTVARAAHVRKIIPYKGSNLFFQNYLETMNVTFIRNGQLTVIPFPFKYLREYVKLF